MTWLRKEVPDWELCKWLKEVGFPQEGEGYWWEFDEPTRIPHNKIITLERRYSQESGISYYKAPTCRELGEWIRRVTPKQTRKRIVFHSYSLTPNKFAQEVIWLSTNGFIDFKKGAK